MGRKRGFDITGDIPWGTHFCLFYETKQELLDILVPYFKAGLENNEWCVWIASPSDKEKTRTSLERVLGDYPHLNKKVHIEFIDYRDFYFKDGVFAPEIPLNRITDKLKEALANSYTGVRGAGDVTQLVRTYRNQFIEYEQKIDKTIHKSPCIISCLYNIKQLSASEVMDVMRSHGLALSNIGRYLNTMTMTGSYTPTKQVTQLQRWFTRVGFEGLSEQEVIELLLSSTLPSGKAVKLARESIRRFKNLRTFLAASHQELAQAGIPPHTAFSIKLLRALPGEVLRQQIVKEPANTSSRELFDYLYYSMRDLKNEVFKVIFYNSQTQIIDIVELFEGTTDQIPIPPREIVENAIKHDANALIFIHNHPSGDPSPSEFDQQLTRDLVFVGMILQIRILDHIIIGHNRYFSFADAGLVEEYELDYLDFKLLSTSRHKKEPAAEMLESAVTDKIKNIDHSNLTAA